MERLWTPWRMEYVGGPKRDACVFCDALAEHDDPATLILCRGEHAFIILNLYPYNSGHAMVVPNAHVADLEDLETAARAELLELATRFTIAARRVLGCAGFNLGLNLGAVAGAGVAEHLHLHAVPRWLGDANFMPILAGTTVMPELLPVTYARLRAELERMDADARGAAALAGTLVALPERGAVVLRRTATGEIVIPAGRVAEAETAAERAVREARDATGVEITIVGWAGSSAVATVEASSPGDWLSVLVGRVRSTPGHAEQRSRDVVLAPAPAVPAALSRASERAIAEDAMPALIRILEGADA